MLPIVIEYGEASGEDCDAPKHGGNLSTLALLLGNCPCSDVSFPASKQRDITAESFQILGRYHESFDIYEVFSDGADLAHGYTSKDMIRAVNYGAIAGAYHTLELLGFSFLHPLSPLKPASLSIDSSLFTENSLNITESPYWPIRIFHHHTQHPLELTEVLQGLDIPMFGPVGPACVNSKSPSSDHGTYCERWEDMVPDVDKMFEWAVANKYNRVEWLLLGNYKWKGFDYSDTRAKRMQILCHLGRSYGLLIGADVPLGNVQQHGWYMVNPRLPYSKQVEQIRDRVDWVLGAGFDFMTTESGLSEFTYPECSLMRDLLEEFSTYVNITWGREAFVKVHCSPGQRCVDYTDPRTGEPINFNHLPLFVHGSMGVMPHTVQVHYVSSYKRSVQCFKLFSCTSACVVLLQIYSLDDPVANAYGNTNFQEVEEYMHYEAQLGNRSVLFYGETAYW